MKKTVSVIITLILLLGLCSCQGQQGGGSVKPLEKASLQIALEDWPVVDGATAFLPYYEHMAALMLDKPRDEARQYIFCSTTDYAYPKLADKEVDLIFCLRPSEDQVRYAKERGVEFECVPFANEAFVFFTNKDNPVDSLTVKQLHDIYAGKITNWKELGGKDQPIIAYQRSEGSGSQTGLYLHVIPQNEVMEPPTEQRIATMGEIVDVVANYDNAPGGLGYSYLYFVTNQHFDEDIKLLKIEGVEPSNANVSAGKYPLISEVCAVFRNYEAEGSLVRQIAQWCISDEGQQLAGEEGYVGIK
jgi:phosphate transport system substrate-binding protein